MGHLRVSHEIRGPTESGLRPLRLGLLAAWPVHYYAPLYRLLAADPRLDFTAIFASDVGLRAGDLGYGSPVKWDVDPIEGYRSTFLRNAHSNAHGGGFLTLRDWDIVSEIRRQRFDALWLHGYNYLTHSLAVVAQRTTGGAVLMREDQTLLTPRPWRKQLAKAVGLPLLFHRSVGLYVGTQNKRWFERYRFPPERLVFVPHSVDNTRLRAHATRLAPQKLSLRRQLGVSDDAGPIILAVMRLIPKKQPLRLLEAFAHVRANVRCTLLIAGSGELEPEMRRVIAERAIPDVVLSGFMNQSEIPRAYAVADVFTLFSGWDETWGLVVNEAMNFRLPVVVSNRVGCAVDLVRPGINGYVVPFDDTGALTQALTTLVRSAKLRAEFGDVSADIIDGWSYEAAARGLLKGVAVAIGPERGAILDDTTALAWGP